MQSLTRCIDHEVNITNWKPIKISKSGPLLSHLLFADDLILFSKADTTSATSIINIFNFIFQQSGQKINFTKSKLLFSSIANPQVQTDLSITLNMKIRCFPITNLNPKSTNYQFILDRMYTRLKWWKAKLLTLTRRLTLIQTIIFAIPTHSMQINILPAKIRNHIDRIQHDFLWGATTDH